MIHLYNYNTDFVKIETSNKNYLKSASSGKALASPIQTRNNLYLLKKYNSLTDLFKNNFEIIPVDTTENLLQSYRLRYEAYCKDRLIPGFYPEDYPEGLEYDEYDERSVHSLLVHKPSGQIAGTVRIILPDQNNIDRKFPLENFASGSLYNDIESLKSLSRIHLGEISRLILAPRFRKYWRENRHQYIMEKESEYVFELKDRIDNNTKTSLYHYKNFKQRNISYPIFGLFAAIVRMSVKHNLKYWYAGMEPRLAKFCRIYGMNFTPISPTVDYYGPCRGYIGYIQDIINTIYYTNMPLWSLLTNDGVLIPPPNQLTSP